MRKAWRIWKEWRPLILWPLALCLMLLGIWAANVHEDFAKGAYLLLLGYIIDQSANEAAQRRLADETARLTASHRTPQGGTE